MSSKGHSTKQEVTCLRDCCQKPEVLELRALFDDNYLYSPITQVSMGTKSDRAHVTSTGSHKHHDTPEIALQQTRMGMCFHVLIHP